MTFLLLAACGAIGLQGAEADAWSALDTGPAWDWEVSVALTGRTFSIAPENLPLVEPEGLAPLLEGALATRVLVHVDEETADTLALAVTFAAADGYQDPCQPIVRLPDARWTDPAFAAGPTEMTTSFGGHPATLRDVGFTGVFDKWGVGWTEGTLDATLDAREVDPALPEGLTTCALLDDLGGACAACEDGEPACVTLRFEGVVADLVDVAWERDPVCG